MDNSQTALQSKAQEIQLEAQANTKIIEEIAGLERYISETYVSRVFYELIQNADDCNSSCFVAKKLGSNLFFLNNGTPFTCSDLESICRSAFSAKQRGVNIGYRGIGFKSTAGVAEEISIYSGNLEVYFSKNKTKKLFASDADVPLLRVPHWGSINSQIKEDAKNLLAEHSCTTCFVLHDVNTDQLLQDMRGIKSNAITFLNSISNITISMANECCISVSKSVAQDQEFKGKVPFQDINIDFKSEANKKSYDENKIARIWKYKSISISSDLEDGIPKRLPKTKAYAQAFLPMLTVTGLGAIINGDFSTDPSRTRIATDEHTKKIMTDVIELISELLYQQSIEQLSPEDSQLLEIIIPYHKADILDISPSIIASSIKNAAKDAGIDYSSFLIKPSWMTIDDYKNYCLLNSRKAVLYEQLSNQDYYGFFKLIGASEISLVMLFDQLEARPLSLQTTMNLIKYINDDIRELRYVKALENEYLQNAKLIACTNKEIQSANEINSSKILQVDEFAFDSITRFCGGLGCIDWHLMLGLDPSHFPAKLIERQKESMKRDGNPVYHPVLKLMQEKPIQASQDSSFLARSTAEAVYVSNQIFSKEGGYSRGLSANDQASWRKAEVFAIDILSSLGIDAKDVSKRNCGCDLIGLENGSEREIYVEVKLIESIGAEFRVTDNEIFAAKEKGDNYWLILIVQPDKNQPPTHVAVIKNAYEMIADNVDRRCIKYEAFCSEYKAKFSQIVFG